MCRGGRGTNGSQKDRTAWRRSPPRTCLSSLLLLLLFLLLLLRCSCSLSALSASYFYCSPSCCSSLLHSPLIAFPCEQIFEAKIFENCLVLQPCGGQKMEGNQHIASNHQNFQDSMDIQPRARANKHTTATTATARILQEKQCVRASHNKQGNSLTCTKSALD